MTLVTKADMQWCRTSAASLMAGGSVSVTAQNPGVNVGTTGWRYWDGPPCEAVSGALPKGGKLFVLNMPAREQLALVKKCRPQDYADFTVFIEGVLMHELTHYRQQQADKTNNWPKRKDGSAEEYLDTYYLNPLELEAHAAHIAYELVTLSPPSPPPPPTPEPTEAQVLATPVGQKIWNRIGSLKGTNRDKVLRKFIDDLVVEVQAHFAAFV